jgi:hypothetical protein
VHGLRRTYHRLINHFGRSRWYSYVTWVKWKLISVHWEIVLNLAQGRCMVCTEHTICLEIILAHPMVLQGDVGQVEAYFGPFRDIINLGTR